jgi:hypothetical protein
VLAAVYERCNTRGCAKADRKSMAFLSVKRYCIDTRLIREMEKRRYNNSARATCSEIVQMYVSLSCVADGSQRRQMTSLLPRNPIHLVSKSLNSCRYLLRSSPSWLDTLTVEQLYARNPFPFHSIPFYYLTCHGAARRNILYCDYVIDSDLVLISADRIE